MAIHWVYDNIRAFGGDPDNIVICGQSAGARSVQAQICTPLNDGLIKGAIIQSAVSMMFGDEDQSMALSLPYRRLKNMEPISCRQSA